MSSILVITEETRYSPLAKKSQGKKQPISDNTADRYIQEIQTGDNADSHVEPGASKAQIRTPAVTHDGEGIGFEPGSKVLLPTRKTRAQTPKSDDSRKADLHSRMEDAVGGREGKEKRQ